jgi:hypothetical protein
MTDGPLPLSDEGFNHATRQHWRCFQYGRRLVSAGFGCEHGGFALIYCECDPGVPLFVVPMTGRRKLCEHALAPAGFTDEADDGHE